MKLFSFKPKKLKILMLADRPGWAVDRNVDRLIENMPFDFTKDFYAEIDSEKLVKISSNFDLIYYSNTDLSFHLNILDQIKTPILMGVRSHRYSNYVKNLHELIDKHNIKVHTLNDSLQKEFPGSRTIGNGIDESFFKTKPFIVGFAGIPNEYKGFPLIKQACQELGVDFKPATGDVPFDKMKEYYESIDLLVSASIQEGFCNPIVECMAMNKPVISTEVGIATNLDLYKIERSVEGIKKGILKYYTRPQVAQHRWRTVGYEMFDYIYDILIGLADSDAEKKKLEQNREKDIKEFYKTA